MDELSEKDLLQYAIDSGMIDVNTIRANIEMNERKRYLESHESKVWKASDGRWATYLPDRTSKTGRKLIKKKTKKQLEDEIVEHYKREVKDPYISDIFDSWVQSKLSYGEIMQQTYDRYKADYDRFIKGSRLERVRFSYITEDMLEDFIKSTIHERELTAKAWSGLRTVILGVFKYAKKKKFTEISITQFMGDIEISPKTFRRRTFLDEESVFTSDEEKRITDYINNQTESILNLGILLCFQTGLRSGEISALKFSDLHENILDVTKTEVRYKDAETGNYVFEVREFTKGRDGFRKVVLTKKAVLIMKKLYMLNPQSEYLFVEDGHRVKSTAFSRKLRKICRYVGVKPKSMHKIRKTYGTKLLNAGVDEKLIEKQMGHTDITTTKNYYYFNNHTVEDAKNIITSAING